VGGPKHDRSTGLAVVEGLHEIGVVAVEAADLAPRRLQAAEVCLQPVHCGSQERQTLFCFNAVFHISVQVNIGSDRGGPCVFEQTLRRRSSAGAFILKKD
jgi:hypothetical protein